MPLNLRLFDPLYSLSWSFSDLAGATRSGGGNGASDGQNYGQIDSQNYGQINGQMNGGAEYIYHGSYYGSSNDAGGGQISGRYFIDQTTGHVVYFQPNGGGQPMAMKMENSAAAATGVTPSGTGYQM